MVKNKKFNEIDLMLSCCRIQIDNYTKKYIEDILIQDCLDWDLITEQSIYHYIAPLVYCNLQKINNKLISKEALCKLRDYYIFNLVKNSYFWSECRELLKILTDSYIKVVPLKGIIFAHLLYHDLGLRPMSDVDILVQECDLGAVEDVLFKLNYQEDRKEYPEEFRKKYLYHLKYFKDLPNGIILPLEVHWGFMRPSQDEVFFDRVWERISKVVIDQQEFFLLSPEDAILQSCLQLKWKIPHRLGFILDIRELLNLNANNLDWNYLIKAAKDNRVKNALYFALIFINKLLNTPISDGLLDDIKPGITIRGILRYYVDNKKVFFKKEKKLFIRVRKIFLHFLLSERKLDFINYFLSMPIKEFAYFYCLPFPSKRTFLLYYLRFFYIIFNPQ